MGRHEQREQVFKLLFRVEFHSPEDMPEQLALFRENNEEVPSWQDADAIAARFEKIKDKIPELDKLLNENTEGWDTTRVGKVELAVLRLGAYELRYENFGKLWRTDRMKYFLYSLAGAFFAVVGYGINVVFISHKYVFQTYGATNFIALYHGVLFDRIQNAVGCLLMLFGYIPDKGFLSLRGVVTMAAFVLLGIYGYVTVKSGKMQRVTGFRSLITLFLKVSFVLNLFVFIFTTSTMVPRYYITIFIFALPVLCFYLEEEKMPFDRFAVTALLTICLILGTGKTVMSFLTVDKNETKRPVAEFLAGNGYDFGFATYNNANIITELTNGEVEIGNIGDPEHLEYFKWSSPMKYYEEGYHAGETFLLLTAEECAEYAEAPALNQGEKVYEDGSYTVYVFDSTEDLMDCAVARQ
jgi:N utilization substance protein B